MRNCISECRQQGKTYIGIPSGSLQQHTIQLLIDAGLLEENPGRKYEVPSTVPDAVFRILDRIDMGRRVIQGVADAGITGRDYLAETGTLDDVAIIDEFTYSKQTRQPSRLVLASKPDIRSSIDQCKGSVIATEMPNLTQKMLAEKFGFQKEDLANIERTNGKTETSVPFGSADAFTDITETGSTLRANGMVELGTLFESSPQLFANRESLKLPNVVRAIEEVATRFRAALEHEVAPQILLELNVPISQKDAILRMLPTAKAADVVPTANADWVVITTLVPEEGAKALMYKLLEAGADDIYDNKSGFTLNQKMRVRVRGS